MNINEIIKKKENGNELNYFELSFFFNEYLDNNITDSEMTRLLKAICENHMTKEETLNLTDIFIKSGDTLDLSEIGITVDKHSTGGVGDKTTLILAPIIASLGLFMPKMSGKSLGYTGGTIDKLESIGIKVNLTEEEFTREIKDIGFAITSQTKNICPMDKKIYALRDVTGTTNEISLIASSIMSKKIACGASIILIDLKVGRGALVEDIESARKLAKLMISIGNNYNRKVKCILTRMDNPLGNNIGNKIEIMEVIDFLNNKVHNNLYDLVVFLAVEIISMVKESSKEEIKKEVIRVIEDKTAYNKFIEFVNYQHGTLSLNMEKGLKIFSKKEGYISSIDARALGEISMKLGAGRIKKEDNIDYSAGIILNKNVNDYVKENDLLCTLYGKDIDTKIEDYFIYENKIIKKENIIIEVIE